MKTTTKNKRENFKKQHFPSCNAGLCLLFLGSDGKPDLLACIGSL